MYLQVARSCQAAETANMARPDLTAVFEACTGTFLQDSIPSEAHKLAADLSRLLGDVGRVAEQVAGGDLRQCFIGATVSSPSAGRGALRGYPRLASSAAQTMIGGDWMR